MKKILFISYYFPPFGGVGSQRSVKFVKYLPYYNWQPIILTVNKKYYYNKIDKSFLKDIPVDIKIIRTKMVSGPKNNFLNKLFQLLSILDSKIWWILYAYKIAKKIIKENEINIIYSTGDPFSSFVFAYLLAKRYKKKFVIDFRDGWIKDPRNKEKNLLGKLNGLLSIPFFKTVLKKSSAIILATYGMYNAFVNSFPQYKNKLHCINNGFDKDDFSRLKPNKEAHNKFHLAFSGSLYKDRDPKYFFDAIKHIKNNRKDIYDKLQINFWGFVDNIFLNKYKHLNIVHFEKKINHDNLLNKIINTDILVFIGERIENNQQITSSKVFEYIATHKPILVLCSKKMGAYKIIKESGLGIFCNINNPIDIADKIIKAVEGNVEVNPNIKKINKYFRKKLTYKLSQIFNQLD